MESLRILMNAPSVRMGEPIAQNIHQAEFVKNLREMGHEVKLVARTVGKIDSDLHPVFSHDIPMARIIFSMDDFFTLERLIEGEKPDIIHDRGYIFGGIGSFMAGKYKIHSVMQIDDDWVRSESMTSPLASMGPYVKAARWWTKRMLHLPDRAFTVSKALKSTICGKYEIPENRIDVIPNGVDTKMFHPEKEPLGLKERYGIKGTVVLFVGALGPWHGIDNLINAMKLMKKEDVSALIIGGSDEDIRRYRDLVVSAGLGEKVVFTGSIPHEKIPNALVEADIAVAPYPNMEFGFSPFKILEYMAAGRAIIASKIPSIEEILSDNEALLTRSWDPEELKKAILSLSEESKREELGRRARKKVVENFTWKKSTEKLIRVYERALGSNT